MALNGVRLTFFGEVRFAPLRVVRFRRSGGRYRGPHGSACTAPSSAFAKVGDGNMLSRLKQIAHWWHETALEAVNLQGEVQLVYTDLIDCRPYSVIFKPLGKYSTRPLLTIPLG